MISFNKLCHEKLNIILIWIFESFFQLCIDWTWKTVEVGYFTNDYLRANINVIFILLMPCLGLFIVVGIWSWHQWNTWEEIWTGLFVEIWKWKYEVCKMWCSQSSSVKRYGNWFSQTFLTFSYTLCFECSQQHVKVLF